MNAKIFNSGAVGILFALLAGAIAQAGTISVVNLPPTGTDLATGITTNKHYVCAFDFGNGTAVNINGVTFTHYNPPTGTDYLSTADANFGGTLTLTSPGTNGVNHSVTINISRTSNSGQGNVPGQADGNMKTLLTDLIYLTGPPSSNDWLQQVYGGLTVGDQYSLRLYYRYWGNSVGDRRQDFDFNGEGTWQAYSNNPVDEDAGTNGACHGARYVEYDFTASSTTVSCVITDLVNNGSPMIEGATLEDDSYPYAPFITYQASAVGIGGGMYQFSIQAVGTPGLSYQWYTNSINSYTGAGMVTDGADYSGATGPSLATTSLTPTNDLLNYYFAVVANSQGSATSSIVQINPAPIVVSQPEATNVENSEVIFNMTAGGFLPLAYQWYANTASNYIGATMLTDGSGLSGSTTNSLVITTNLQDYYFVVVTNAYGSATSAITAYNPAPYIVAQPTATKAGAAVQLTVTANGWPTLGYQWYFNDSAAYSGASAMADGNGVSGSATPTVTITNLLDYYFVVVTNSYGSVTSEVVAAAIPLTVTAAGEPIWNQTTQTNIIVTFSDMVNPDTATSISNYALNNGATVSSAALVASNEVSLTTSILDPADSYTLTVSGVKDMYFNLLMTPSSTNIAVGDYPANLALWVRAGTGVSTDSGTNTVYQWNDLSGNGNNLASYDGTSYEPQLVTNAWGDPVIRFTGTNETLMFANPSPSLAITGDMSVIAVVNFATLAGGTNGEIIGKAGGANLNIPAPYDYYVGSSAASLYRGNGSSYGQVTAISGPSIGTPHILVVTETGNTVSHYLDGSSVGTGVLNNGFQETNALDAGNPFFIGTRQDQVNRLTGDIAELMVAGSTVSSYDVSELTSYLAQEHDIVLVNTSPTNLRFSLSGNQLTLSWPADHTGWTLQAQTNSLSAGLGSQWVNVTGSASVHQMVIPINVTNACVFYRLVYP